MNALSLHPGVVAEDGSESEAPKMFPVQGDGEPET